MSNTYTYVGPINYAHQFYNNAVQYAQNPNYLPYAGSKLGNQIEKEAGSGESLGGALLFGGAFMGIPHIKKVLTPVQTYEAIKSANTVFNELKDIETFTNLAKTEQGKAYSNFFNLARKGKNINPELKEALRIATENYKAALKSGNSAEIARCAEEMNQLIANGGKTNAIVRWTKKLFGKPAPEFKEASKVIENAKNAGKAASEVATVAKTAADAAKASGKAARALYWTKDALKTGGFKGMAIFSGIIEGFTEVLPAFCKGGASEGTKQVVKSAATVAADAAGWAVGAKAGAAAGAAIGSIFPGAGTAIGGAIGGIIGGIAGAFLTRKVAKAVVGKSFSEKEAEKEKIQEKAIALQQAQPTQQINQYAANPFAQEIIPGIEPFSYDFNSPLGLC